MKIINGEPKFSKEDLYHLSEILSIHTPEWELTRNLTKYVRYQEKSITELIVHHYHKGVIGLSVNEIDRLQEFRSSHSLMDEIEKEQYTTVQRTIKSMEMP